MQKTEIRFYYKDSNGEEAYGVKRIEPTSLDSARAYVKTFIKDEFLDFEEFFLNKKHVVTIIIM